MEELGYEASQGQYWLIYTHDNNNGNETDFYIWTGAGWPPFKWAIMGAYEPQGLYACDGLSTSDVERFTLDALYEGGPNWNSYNSAESLVTWNTGTTSQSPMCSYDAYSASGTDYGLLFWAN
jgi:hypothetical protein